MSDVTEVRLECLGILCPVAARAQQLANGLKDVCEFSIKLARRDNLRLGTINPRACLVGQLALLDPTESTPKTEP